MKYILSHKTTPVLSMEIDEETGTITKINDLYDQKKWTVADGKRLLIKGGSGATRQEPYNEVLATIIMERLNIPHVQGIDDEFRNILKGSAFIDDTRCDSLCNSLNSRVELLYEYVKTIISII